MVYFGVTYPLPFTSTAVLFGISVNDQQSLRPNESPTYICAETEKFLSRCFWVQKPERICWSGTFLIFLAPLLTDLPAPYLICLLLTCWSILKLGISSSIYMYLFIILCEFIVLMLYVKGYGNTKDIAMNNNLSLKSTVSKDDWQVNWQLYLSIVRATENKVLGGRVAQKKEQ